MSHTINIAKKLVIELTNIGVFCYIWHKAETSISVYIRFDDNRIGSVRIADHPGKTKLRYKYNLRSDISGKHPLWVKDDGIWRCYLLLSRWKEMVPILKAKAEQVKAWSESKYSYYIPKHKRNEKK